MVNSDFKDYIMVFTVALILFLIVSFIFDIGFFLAGIFITIILLVYYGNKIRKGATNELERGKARLYVAYMSFLTLGLLMFGSAILMLPIKTDPTSYISDNSIYSFWVVSFLIILPITVTLVWRGERRIRLAAPPEDVLEKQKKNIYYFAIVWFLSFLISSLLLDIAGNGEGISTAMNFIFTIIPGTLAIGILGSRVSKPKHARSFGELNKLRDDLNKLKNENKTLQSNNNGLKNQISSKEQQISRLKSEINQLNSKVNDLKANTSQKPDSSIEKLKKDIDLLKNEINRRDSKISDLQTRLRKSGGKSANDPALISEYKERIRGLNRKIHKLNELLRPFESTLTGMTRKELYRAEIRRIRDNPDPYLATRLDVVVRDILNQAPQNVSRLNSEYEKAYYKMAFYNYLQDHLERCENESDKKEQLEREYMMLRQSYDPASYPNASGLRRNKSWATQRIFDLDESKRKVQDEL